MKRFVRMSLLAAAAVSLAACGSGPKLGGGKQGAAQALYQASDSTGKTAQDLLIKRAMGQHQQLDLLDASVKVDCAHGGSVKMSVDILDSIPTGGETLNGSFDLEYDDCNQDGKNEINGEMSMTMLIDTSSTNLKIGFRMKGELDISGEVDDSIEADVTHYIAITGTNVTMKINGSIETSEAKYSYANETFTFVEGPLPVAADDAS